MKKLTDAERAEKFWARLDRTGECWIWTGPVFNSGYGQVAGARQPMLAHRFAFELTNGSPAAGTYVCHHCDTPLCCRPEHLYAGTPKQNSGDRDRRNRRRILRGVEQPMAKLTEDQVREMRRLHGEGMSYPKLAAIFALSAPAVGRVCRGEGYANVA